MAYWGLIDTGLSILKKVVPVFLTNSRKERFFDKANTMFLVSSQEGIIMDLNDCFANTLGYDRKALKGTPFMRLVHPDDHLKTAQAMEELAIGSYISWSFANRYRHSNGKYVTIEWSATKNGEIYAVARVLGRAKQ